MDERIRLSSTDSKNSVDKENFLDVEFQHHTKVFPFLSFKDTIDQREQFEKERAESTKYRLILTINPYCSNILFNAVTEIVQNEGTDNPNELNIATADGINPNIVGYNIRGKKNSVTNTDMVRNTEYANGSNPFVYHCGYDIFNNHILRNQTFKLVNPITNNTQPHKNTNNTLDVENNFNTIRDIMRYADGKEVTLVARKKINDVFGVNNSSNSNYARHLYLKDDILDIVDSINANLNEQNGWWGFYNRSSIPSCECKEVGNDEYKWEDMNISKVFNGENASCSFIQMYPDSTLYSFNPKYNKFQNREEHNWDICITYPYENDSKKLLVNGGDGLNALLLVDYYQTVGTSGQSIIMFRSYVKHNLKKGDNIRLFYSKNNDNGESNFLEIEDVLFNITNVGDLENNNQDYYFYINDVEDLLLELGEHDGVIDEDYTFRFVKVVNNRNCKYYYRKFRKLPNFKFKRDELTDDIARNEEDFNLYIHNNCLKKDSNEMLPFTKEQYPLAFSNTIYGDDNTQVTFTDTLDIDKLTDNLGRPLTELFVTIIKRNKGHDLWYESTKTADKLKNIEFSHCFGKVCSGIDVYSDWSDDDGLLEKRLLIGDCTLLYNNSETINKLQDDITIEQNEFYGDVVELDTYNMKETVLSDVYFRFNTEQREHIFESGVGGEELNCGVFKFDEILQDDYDWESFLCQEYDADEFTPDGQKIIGGQRTTYRPEGYYYKAHYSFLVREFGAMRQGSHKEISVYRCKPTQANGLFIEVVTSLRNGLTSGDTVFLCDDENNLSIPLVVNSVLSSVRFLLNPINPMERDKEYYISVYDIVNGLMYSEHTITNEDIVNRYTWLDENEQEHYATDDMINQTVNDYYTPKYILRIKNTDIPFYAYKVGRNLYLWRDLLTVGNQDTLNLKEYPFANGHFYINKEINFFLKRQDPFGNNGLYDEELFPNDIYGNIKERNNYEYKDETNSIC